MNQRDDYFHLGAKTFSLAGITSLDDNRMNEESDPVKYSIRIEGWYTEI